MEGDIRLTWLRRLVRPRAIAIIAATGVTISYGEQETFKLLILTQVILSLQLPFAVCRSYSSVTADRAKMDQLMTPLALLATRLREVLVAYGWDDLAERAEPDFLDEDNENDHTYQGRLFWPSDFRDAAPSRLLALNAERHAEEVAAGLAVGITPNDNVADDDDADIESNSTRGDCAMGQISDDQVEWAVVSFRLKGDARFAARHEIQCHPILRDPQHSAPVEQEPVLGGWRRGRQSRVQRPRHIWRELRSQVEACETPSLYHADMVRLGSVLTDTFCRALSGNDHTRSMGRRQLRPPLRRYSAAGPAF